MILMTRDLATTRTFARLTSFVSFVSLRLSPLAVLCLFSFAEAAIPNSRTITSRLAKNSGKGVFVIDQQLRFSGPEGIVLKERWLVQNAENLRLTVQGEKTGEFRFDALYRENQRLSTAPSAIFASPGSNPNPELVLKTEPGKDPKTTPLPADFFEPYLYYRTSARYLEHFVKQKILPPSVLRDRPRISNIQNYTPTPEIGVRLGRAGGTVSWVFGEPTPVDAKSSFPGAWIEQDNFVLKKLRHLSQAEMTLSEHASAGGGLRLARERTIVWKSNDAVSAEPRAVTIKVTSVKNYPDKSLAQQFLPSSISSSELRAARLPEATIVREFYTRFR
jgi:hypothetical protein